MLEYLFEPRGVAVIGASRKPQSAGNGVLKSLLRGGVFSSKTNKRFRGSIYAVNPNADKVLGKKCYRSILDVKGIVDLAVIVVPAKIVPGVVLECAKKRIKYAIIISAGFGELGGEGRRLEDKILRIAKKGKIRLVGPNCLGIFRPSSNLNASFGPCMPYPGKVAFFSQSGALIDSVIDWSLETKYGFSAIVSLGNKVDLTITDFLLWAKDDPETKAIALYMEGIKDGRNFMKISKEVSKRKPIIVLKSGRTTTGMSAVSSHTGSLAGSYEIYKTAFRQSGITIADNVDELFDMAEALASQPPCRNNVAIITNGGGAGVLCADHCETNGVNLAVLSDATIRKLDGSNKMHPAYSRKNPLDLVGDALHDRYDIAIKTVLSQEDVYGLIVIQTLQTMTEPMLDALAVIKSRKQFPKKPIITSYMGGKFSRKAIEMLEANHVPEFNIPYKTARTMKALIDRHIWLDNKA